MNINTDAYLPNSTNNIVTILDLFDIPSSNKQTISNAIHFDAKNDTNLIILNDRTNI